MVEKCIEGCEFLRFANGKFYCKFYKPDLVTNEQDVTGKITIFRCDPCVKDGEIGKDEDKAVVIKMKRHVGLIMDSFYSFKDDMESEISELYRILKGLEDKE